MQMVHAVQLQVDGARLPDLRWICSYFLSVAADFDSDLTYREQNYLGSVISNA